MDIRCPQCDQSFAADPAADDRYTCTSCSVSLFVKREPDFQAIAALAFPAQNTPSAPLKSFFTIAPSQVPGEWTGDASATPAELSRSSLGATDDAPSGDANGSTLDQPPPPFPQPDTAMLDDEVEMTSMAGGSFASALTAAPLTPPAVGSSGMAPPPWENDQPGATPPPQESWAVGPPALPPRAPPPLAKKPKSAEDFARALGLPEIAIQEPERPMASPRTTTGVAADAAQDDDDDSTLAKPKSKALWVVAVIAIVLVGGGVFAALNAPPPTPSAPLQPSGPSAEDSPTSGSDPVASGPSGPLDSKAAQGAAEKRAKVIDHYNLGNKYYLQRKYPQALEEFRLALELDATFALAHRGMGVTYAKQGKAELAIKEYKTYLKLAPDAKDASQVQKVIKEFEQ